MAKLEQDAETARKLSAVNKEQVDAIAQVLRGQIEAQERRSFWSNQALAVFYALLGVAFSELTRWLLRRKRRRKTQLIEPAAAQSS